MAMREKQILARAVGIQIQNCGSPRIFQSLVRDTCAVVILKSSKIRIYDLSFQIEAQLSLKNAWLTLILFFDFNNPCKDVLFARSHSARKNICFGELRS